VLLAFSIVAGIAGGTLFPDENPPTPASAISAGQNERILWRMGQKQPWKQISPRFATTLARSVNGRAVASDRIALSVQSFAIKNAALSMQASGGRGPSSSVVVTAGPYRAVCDGKTDDTASIQAALKSGSKSVRIPSGVTCAFTGQLNVPAGVEFYGGGKGSSTLRYTGTGNPSGTYAAITAQSNASIHDLQVKGPIETPGKPDSYVNAGGISVAAGASEVKIDKVAVSHFWKYSCVGVQGSRVTVSNSDLEYCHFGISATGNNHKILNNYLNNHFVDLPILFPWRPTSPYWGGFLSEGLSNTLVQGNTAEKNGQGGFYTGGNGSASFNNSFIGNHANDNWEKGFDHGVTGEVTSTNYIKQLTLSQNTATDNLETNFWSICNQGATITGNTSTYTADYARIFGKYAINGIDRAGIVVSDLCGSTPLDTESNIKVTGNHINDYQGSKAYGINFNIHNAGSTGNYIVGNSTNAGDYVSAFDKSANTYKK
jgi:hypothetical protein